ncbi:sugar kinase [Paraburkholderia tropica]|uniref:2-dehydro-3-deoxygluconokinase n=1 Tax=Paraburkholderia tropica TaxID=92647 RepID=A0AAQ1GFW9_9BURK|nr:sugar kinase [Paraburkholderia tropica]RQN39249.1 sugar kinase [Paraburkholderia tropica]SEJ71458.1 2-dehydro-3-deoxygluconokinase [Paraburkholderia tropica]
MAASDVKPADTPAILALGEPMIEFNQSASDDARQFLQGFGGDTSNFCVAAARQGASVGYVTRLGDDAFGKLFLDLWRAEGVDVQGVASDAQSHTGVYFVTHDASGHAFSYLRKDSAASRMSPRTLPRDLLAGTHFLHVSGISQAISASACDAVFEAIAVARQAGAAICYDPNVRLKLWPLARARAVIEATAREVDYMLPSLEDAQTLTGLNDAEAIVAHYLALGVRVVCLKLGGDGVLVARGEQRTRIAGHAVNVVDATGAGDCFDGAFVARLAAGDTPEDAARYANAAAALSTQGFGAVAPIPRPDAIAAQLKN